MQTSRGRLVLVSVLAALLLALGASADSSVNAQVTRYTLDITNTSVAQNLANGIYGAFCSITTFSGTIMPLTLDEVGSALPSFLDCCLVEIFMTLLLRIPIVLPSCMPRDSETREP
jgi:hypothetical protein